MNKALSTASDEQRLVETLLSAYEEKYEYVERFMNSVAALMAAQELRPYIHSIKTRMKDRDHLQDKLFRKIYDAKKRNEAFEITCDNLLERITDLGGVRLLHLHTKQMASIDPAIRSLLENESMPLAEAPFARTWDDEYRKFFSSIGIQAQNSKTLYTSVHYVVMSKSKVKTTCEIQVRTLSEEVWGEVDHTINYPHQCESIACKEQILTLARVTSSATRLVDSIFASMDEHKNLTSDGRSIVGSNGSKEAP